MTERTKGGVLIIGIGNDYRGDDGAGLLVARKLATMGAGNMRVLELPGEGTELIEAWRGEDHVVLVDACRSGAAIGSITRLDVNEAPLPSGFFSYSTHAFGLAEAVETSRNLNILPRDMIVFAIEGKSFAQGAPMSTDVEDAVLRVANSILDLSARAGLEPGHAG